MSSGRIAPAWRNLWGSVAFRLTFNYGLLAVCTTLFLLVFVYVQIVDVLQTQFSRQVTITVQRLNVHFKEYGLDALQLEINQLLSDQTDVDTEIYLLIDRRGNKLAGNLDLFVADEFTRPTLAPVLLSVQREGMPASSFIAIHRLDDGSMLVVGHDTRDLQEIKILIGKASVAATLVALLLVLIGTYLFRRELRRRVEGIRDTAIHVGTGELTRRIPAVTQEDEFEHLRSDINQMLDRIETLMNGVRNVSDSIAHNVRTPLARVLAKLHKARNLEHGASPVSVAIDSASAEIMDLISVTEKLLLIAEAESGVRRQTFRPVRLDSIVRDVIDLYEALAEEKGITIESQYDVNAEHGSELWVLADTDLLAGVIANLLENSLKYAGDGAHIIIKTSEPNGAARLAVYDNGPGVPAEHLGQLGTRFYRLRTDLPGSGLGLASVRAIVSLHGGTLRFPHVAAGFGVEIELSLQKKA